MGPLGRPTCRGVSKVSHFKAIGKLSLLVNSSFKCVFLAALSLLLGVKVPHTSLTPHLNRQAAKNLICLPFFNYTELLPDILDIHAYVSAGPATITSK